MSFFFECNSNLLVKRVFLLLKAASVPVILDYDVGAQFASLLIKIPTQNRYLSLNRYLYL